jgi:hypothetical protein
LPREQGNSSEAIVQAVVHFRTEISVSPRITTIDIAAFGTLNGENPNPNSRETGKNAG